MSRPRLQRTATVRREKVQLSIREQSFFFCNNYLGSEYNNLPGAGNIDMSIHSSDHPSAHTFLKVYMELGSYFLFLQEQIKDIIIILGNVSSNVTKLIHRL